MKWNFWTFSELSLFSGASKTKNEQSRRNLWDRLWNLDKNEKIVSFQMFNIAKNTIIWCSLEYLLNSLQLILSFSTFVKFRIFWCFHRTSLFQIDLVLNLFEPYGTSLNKFRPDWTKNQLMKISFLCILVKNFDTRCRCGDFFMILKFQK